jgi:hypothetical protein
MLSARVQEMEAQDLRPHFHVWEPLTFAGFVAALDLPFSLSCCKRAWMSLSLCSADSEQLTSHCFRLSIAPLWPGDRWAQADRFEAEGEARRARPPVHPIHCPAPRRRRPIPRVQLDLTTVASAGLGHAWCAQISLAPNFIPSADYRVRRCPHMPPIRLTCRGPASSWMLCSRLPRHSSLGSSPTRRASTGVRWVRSDSAGPCLRRVSRPRMYLARSGGRLRLSLGRQPCVVSVRHLGSVSISVKVRISARRQPRSIGSIERNRCRRPASSCCSISTEPCQTTRVACGP